MVGMVSVSTRAKWRALTSAGVSMLKKCLTPPTLSERRYFANYQGWFRLRVRNRKTRLPHHSVLVPRNADDFFRLLTSFRAMDHSISRRSVLKSMLGAGALSLFRKHSFLAQQLSSLTLDWFTRERFLPMREPQWARRPLVRPIGTILIAISCPPWAALLSQISTNSSAKCS